MIVSWRSGATPSDFDAVAALAKAFNVTVGFLLTGKPDQTDAAGLPAIAEVFTDAGPLFEGYCQVSIRRLVPRSEVPDAKKTKADEGDD